MATWKWAENQALISLQKTAQYPGSELAHKQYNQELEVWLSNSWLIPYPEKEYRPPKYLVPLMSVIQENKKKVHTL